VGGGGAERLMCGGSWFSAWNPVSWDIERNDDWEEAVGRDRKDSTVSATNPVVLTECMRDGEIIECIELLVFSRLVITLRPLCFWVRFSRSEHDLKVLEECMLFFEDILREAPRLRGAHDLDDAKVRGF